MAKAPLWPAHPERICWGCDKYCPADDLACGNGTIRTPHPSELFGEDWVEWSEARDAQDDGAADESGATTAGATPSTAAHPSRS
jgi:hypothetical protein